MEEWEELDVVVELLPVDECDVLVVDDDPMDEVDEVVCDVDDEVVTGVLDDVATLVVLRLLVVEKDGSGVWVTARRKLGSGRCVESNSLAPASAANPTCATRSPRRAVCDNSFMVVGL